MQLTRRAAWDGYFEQGCSTDAGNSGELRPYRARKAVIAGLAKI